MRIQQATVQNQQVAGVGVADDLATHMAAVEQRHPDISQYSDKIGAEMQQYPTLGKLMQEGAPSERAKAFEDLYLVIKSRETTDNSREALRRVTIRSTEEARKAREDAQVVSGGRGVGEADAPTGVDSFRARFRAITGQDEDSTVVNVAEDIRRGRARAEV
jgi:hypothetical protein